MTVDVPVQVERRQREPGVEGEEREGAGGTGGEGAGESSTGGGSDLGGSSSGSGSSGQAFLRAQSTLRLSSESENEDEAAGSANDGGQITHPTGGEDDDGGGKSMPCVVSTAVLADDNGSTYGQARDSFEGTLRFRGRAGQGRTKKPPPFLSSTPEGSAAAAAADGGGGATPVGAVGGSAGAADLAGDAVRRGEEGRASGARGKNRPLVAAGRAWRGARRVLRWAADGLLVVLVFKGSVPVVKNMAGVGGGQKMNQNFDRCALVPLGR